MRKLVFRWGSNQSARSRECDFDDDDGDDFDE
jgi:hypothetical protein